MPIRAANWCSWFERCLSLYVCLFFLALILCEFSFYFLLFPSSVNTPYERSRRLARVDDEPALLVSYYLTPRGGNS